MPWTRGGVLHDTRKNYAFYNLLGIWLMFLTHEGVP